MKQGHTVDESLRDGDILRVEGITKRFPGVTALHDVSLDIRAGEIHALLGENGAGKSTLSSVIAGLVRPDEGSMTWQGRSYAPASPREAMAAQIGLIHQELKLLPSLSVAENVFVGRIPRTLGLFVDRKTMREQAAAQLERLGLEIDTRKNISELRVAEQQQVEIAKALTLNARLLILDEPTAALGARETDALFQLVDRLRSEGMSFIYISHRLEEIERIANRVSVLRDGELIATHETGSVPVKQLVEEMVGRKIERLFPSIPHPPGDAPEVLRVDRLSSAENAFRNVNFTVSAGEIFGIAGIVGAGRSELVRAISGVDPIAAGTIRIGGVEKAIRHPYDAIREGIVLIPEDRKELGLILNRTINENIALTNFDRLTNKGWVRPSRFLSFCKDVIERFGIKGRPETKIRQLSGGNQQKVLISKWVARQPRIVILDEPTRGVDVGARHSIYTIIAELAEKGMAVIVVSSDLEEVLGLSHRVMVLSRGEQRGILEREEVNSVSIMELATV